MATIQPENVHVCSVSLFGKKESYTLADCPPEICEEALTSLRTGGDLGKTLKKIISKHRPEQIP